MNTNTKSETRLQPSHINVYNFIEKYIIKNKFAPEVEEIATGIKMTSRHTYRIVADLCELGYISKVLHGKRSIKIEKPMK